MPIRIQRKRTRGWRMPENTIYVGRPTYFGNMFKVTKGGVINTLEMSHADCVAQFREWLENTDAGMLVIVQARKFLKGHNLACFCPLDKPCHADVLLEVANK